MRSNRMQPYGDIFIVDTPHLDKFADRMYAEQKQREQLQRIEAEKLDKEMADEIGVIRSEDRDAYIEKYNKYKALKKELLFNPKLQRNPKEYNRVQMEAEKAFSDAKTFAGRSAEVNDAAKEFVKGYVKNPDLYSDDFSERINYLRRYPLDKLTQTPIGDVTDMSKLVNTGPNEKFIASISKARGTKPTTRYSENISLDKEGLQSQMVEYQFTTTDTEYKNALMREFIGPNERAAAKQWTKMLADNPQLIIDVQRQYDSIPPEKWKMMGKEKGELVLDPNKSKAENLATYLAMQEAISAQPVIKKSTPKANQGAIMDKKFEQQKALQAIKKNDQKELAAMRNALSIKLKQTPSANKKEVEEDAIDELYNTIYNNAVEEGSEIFTYEDGKNGPIYRVAGLAALDNALKKPYGPDGKVIPPDRIWIDKFGGIRVAFYKRDKKDNIVKTEKGVPIVDRDKSQTLDQETFKTTVLGKTFLGVGAVKKRVESKGKNPAGKKPTEKIDYGKKYNF